MDMTSVKGNLAAFLQCTSLEKTVGSQKDALVAVQRKVK
jgi:hypothetical protein